MKTVTIIRHAKSSWDDFSLLDIDRPLNKRGKRDAPVMANMLKENGIDPELFLVSPAKRTRETSKYFLDVFQKSDDVVSIEKQLYHGTEYNFIDSMFGVDDHIDDILMFGHNPGITHLANLCTDDFIENVPTCGILIIKFDMDQWVDASWNKASLEKFLYPKMVKH